MRSTVDVRLWGTTVGRLGYAPGEKHYATFEFDSKFIESGIQLSPVWLKYPPLQYTFDQLSLKSFQGLPGFIADSLPDKFGNSLIDIYMADKGIPSQYITALDRLNYVGKRGMGALEYKPGESLPLQRTALNLNHLSELADMVLQKKSAFHKQLLSAEDKASALSMIRIGSSAGGARSKALVAISGKGNLFDGTVNHGAGYSYWVLKFDSGSNKDKDSTDPEGMPVLEYIYSIMAEKAGINMPRTDLIDDGHSRHFLIERFDRNYRQEKPDKLHYASWAGLAHADRDAVNSYEQLILLSRQLLLGQTTETAIFRRAVFNLMGRNHDDHTKNTGFLMDRSGKWKLSPAFDITYSYNHYGRWTKNHQCWLNRKNNNFEIEDLIQFGKFCNLSEKKSRTVISQVSGAFSDFSDLAREWELSKELKKTVESNLRMNLFI